MLPVFLMEKGRWNRNEQLTESICKEKADEEVFSSAL